MLEINTMVEGHLFFHIKEKQFNETYAEVKLNCYMYLHAILEFVGIISATCCKFALNLMMCSVSFPIP